MSPSSTPHAPLTTYHVNGEIGLDDGDSGYVPLYETTPRVTFDHCPVTSTWQVITETHHRRATRAGTRGEHVRLLWLNTPERGQPRWREARADLQAWVTGHLKDHLRVDDYGVEARGGRMLGDLYYTDTEGVHHSASQHMLTLGWLPYIDD